jgi:hypothetical protein
MPMVDWSRDPLYQTVTLVFPKASVGAVHGNRVVSNNVKQHQNVSRLVSTNHACSVQPTPCFHVVILPLLPLMEVQRLEAGSSISSTGFSTMAQRSSVIHLARPELISILKGIIKICRLTQSKSTKKSC